MIIRVAFATIKHIRTTKAVRLMGAGLTVAESAVLHGHVACKAENRITTSNGLQCSLRILVHLITGR